MGPLLHTVGINLELQQKHVRPRQGPSEPCDWRLCTQNVLGPGGGGGVGGRLHPEELSTQAAPPRAGPLQRREHQERPEQSPGGQGADGGPPSSDLPEVR